MVAEQEGWCGSALGRETGVGDWRAADEVRPAVPAATLHLVEEIGCVADRPAAAVVGALVDREQASVDVEAEPVGVAKAPGNQLEVAPVGLAAEDSGRARQCRCDPLA